MYAIEFETDVKGRYIEIPDNQKFKFKHVKVLLMTEETEEAQDGQKYIFDDLMGKLGWTGDAISAQRSIRDEW